MRSATTIRTDFDYSALSEPVTNHDAGSLIWSRIGTVFFLMFAFALAFGISLVLYGIYRAPSLIGIPIALVISGVAITIGAYTELHEAKERIRLKRFAEANNLTFYVGPPSGEKQTGAIFTIPDSQNQQLEVVRSPGDPFYEFGNYRYIIGSGRNQLKCSFGFVHFKLTRHLPNMLLSSRQDDRLTKKLPLRPNPSQRLTLEGNFNDYFSLYVPKGYEVDALTIFTPDVMQMMIKAVHAYNCEVVADDFYIYTDQYTSKDPGQLQEVLSMLPVLMPKFERESQNYRDDRVGMAAADTVADPGKHLRPRTEILLYTLVAMALGYIIFAFIFFAVASIELY